MGLLVGGGGEFGGDGRWWGGGCGVDFAFQGFVGGGVLGEGWGLGLGFGSSGRFPRRGDIEGVEG